MTLSVVGINHKTASVRVREQLAFAAGALEDVLGELNKMEAVEEIVVLSTCNRSEFYSYGAKSGAAICHWLDQHSPLLDSKTQLYHLEDHNAVEHLCQVACGLDSMVLGEPQILGQLKAAFATAKAQQSVGRELGKLFEHAFSTAKQIRNQTDIGKNPVSMAYAAVRLGEQIFGSLKNSHALLIGAGETIDLVGQHLVKNHIGTITIANRHRERAQILAGQFGGTGISIAEIPTALTSANIVISSTASPLPLLGKGLIETALKQRKHRPFFMVDLAVPRDIESEVGELDDVYLYTVDDLEGVVEDNKRARQMAAQAAVPIIQDSVADFMRWQRGLKAADTIKELRQHVKQISDDNLNRALKMLQNGTSPEEALAFYAHNFCNKLLHQPSIKLRQAAENNKPKLIKAAQNLFDLQD